MKKGKLLIIDDNEDILFALNLLLEPYMEQIRVATQPERIDHFMRTFIPDIILLDMNFKRDAISGQEGFYWLEKIKKIDPDVVVLFMTAYSDTDKAVRAIKAGATDFIPKPWEKEKLLATLSSALELRESRAEVRNLKKQVEILSSPEDAGFEIIGESEPMQAIFATVDKLKNTDANILILGENGTGKDLVARALYHQSPRSENLFVGIDEIGNLSLSMQAKLLTALEKRQITRLGATQPIPIDIRLICATNVNIHHLVAEGTFRQDLLYRINTIELHIPPLRERGNDVILLAEHFLSKYARKYKKDLKGINRDGKNKLHNYAWPGNVRELQHAIERAVILSESNWLRPEDFILRSVPLRDKEPSDELNLTVLEKEAIERALRRAEGNITRAAELLGITRFTLYRKLEKFGL